MAHKNQHIVPRCYLKNFVNRDNNNPLNIYHKNGIFINDKFLKGGWEEKGVDNPMFTSSYFYSLQVKNEEQKLVVEKYLSNIEYLYDNVVKNIKNGQIYKDDLTMLKVFVYFQHLRKPSFMSMMQKGFDQGAKWVDKFSGNNEAEQEVLDLSKKMIMTGIHKNNVILNQTCLLVINNTDQAFLTSDNPVIHKIINFREVSKFLGKEFLTKDYNNTIEKPFFYMPITPRIAFISSDFLENSAALDNSNGIIQTKLLNILMCLNAEKYVYAENKHPLINEKHFKTCLLSCFHDKKTTYAKVVTDDDIYYVEDIYDLEWEDFKITFKTNDNKFLNELFTGSDIKLVETYTVDGNSGMRDAKISFLDKEKGIVTIELYFKPPGS